MYVLPTPRVSGISVAYALPDSPLTLQPSATVFHYAHCLFEGLKAYRDTSGKVTLFRPDMNMKRMNTSAERIAMPVRVIYAQVTHHVANITLAVDDALDVQW